MPESHADDGRYNLLIESLIIRTIIKWICSNEQEDCHNQQSRFVSPNHSLICNLSCDIPPATKTLSVTSINVPLTFFHSLSTLAL